MRRRFGAALRRRDAAEPYVLGDLSIDCTARRVTLAGRAVQLTATGYALLAELSANAGRVLTHQHLRPMRTIVSKLRRKLGEDADASRYIFTEHRVGFRMPRGNAPDREPPAGL